MDALCKLDQVDSKDPSIAVTSLNYFFHSFNFMLSVIMVYVVFYVASPKHRPN